MLTIPSITISSTQILSSTAFILIVAILWKRRWLYYYSWNLPGPLGWPILGSALEFITSCDTFYSVLQRYVDDCPEIFKIWLGPHLHIVSTRPEDACGLLGTSLEKSVLYINDECMEGGIVVSPVSVWRGRRKAINKTFNQKVVDSYTDALINCCNKMVAELEETHKLGPVKMVPLVWRYTIYTLCETLMDVDYESVRGVEDYMDNIRRFEVLTVQRVLRPWLLPKFFFKLSALGKEMDKVSHNMEDFIHEVWKLRVENLHQINDANKSVRQKRYLNHLISLIKRDEITEDEVLKEMQNMMIAGTETSTYVVGFTLLILGFSPQIQAKVYDEQFAIFGGDDRDPTLDDVNRMEYLERVLKESMRFFPAIPFVMRYIDKTIRIGSQVFPEGCNVIVPFFKIHMRPEIWVDPTRFDPDRFLDDFDEKHKGAYLPFSFGPRNCPGWKMGLVSMKFTLSAILRNYIVTSVDVKRIEDIQITYGILMYPTDEAEVVLTKRNHVNVV